MLRLEDSVVEKNCEVLKIVIRLEACNCGKSFGGSWRKMADTNC